MTEMRIYHTVKHLKLRQVIGQIMVSVRELLSRPEAIMMVDVLSFDGLKWDPDVHFLPSGPQENQQQDILQGEMTFLNSTQYIGWEVD